MPVQSHPRERSREAASTASSPPSGTPAPSVEPSPSPTDAVEPSGRSARSAVAFVVAALVLTVTLGTWLKAHEERSAPALETDTAVDESHASDGSPTPVVSPSPTPAGVGPVEHPSHRQARGDRGGCSVLVQAADGWWERFGSISVNKSIVGPQGAEAIIYWTSFPDGAYAEPCGQLLGSRPLVRRPDLAAAVATAPGTELVAGPSDVTVGGHPAKHVVLTVREDVGCDPGFFYTWQDVQGGALWAMTGVGDTIRVWIVDVDGTRLFIEAETTTQADSDLEQEIQQIVGSIRFDESDPQHLRPWWPTTDSRTHSPAPSGSARS